jgi:aryl carrier-like protein
MHLKEIVLEGLDWIRLTQGKEKWRAVVNTVLNLLVP